MLINHKTAAVFNKVMRVLVERDSILHEQRLLLGKDKITIAQDTFQDLESVRYGIDTHKNAPNT